MTDVASLFPAFQCAPGSVAYMLLLCWSLYCCFYRGGGRVLSIQAVTRNAHIVSFSPHTVVSTEKEKKHRVPSAPVYARIKLPFQHPFEPDRGPSAPIRAEGTPMPSAYIGVVEEEIRVRTGAEDIQYKGSFPTLYFKSSTPISSYIFSRV